MNNDREKFKKAIITMILARKRFFSYEFDFGSSFDSETGIL